VAGVAGLKAEVSSVFTSVFPSPQVDALMAVSLLAEAESALERLLRDTVVAMARDLFAEQRAGAVLQACVPAMHYQVGIAAFDAEDAWVGKYAHAILHAELRATLSRCVVHGCVCVCVRAR